MRSINATSGLPWAAYRRWAQKLIDQDGAVVLVSQSRRAHRQVRSIYKSFRTRTGAPINPRIFVNLETNQWHLLLAPSDYFVELDELGVPKALPVRR
jgi:mitochondrial fission protein ELM1